MARTQMKRKQSSTATNTSTHKRVRFDSRLPTPKGPRQPKQHNNNEYNKKEK